MMSTEMILSICTEPLDCQRLARADQAILTLEESKDGKITAQRIMDFFTGYARGYNEAIKAVKRGDIKI